MNPGKWLQSALGLPIIIMLLAACAVAPTMTPTDAPAFTPTPRAGEERAVGGAPMMFVPAGEFLMGSNDDDKAAADDEKPQHTVYLDAFWIDKFEATNAQYEKCVTAGRCQPPASFRSDTRGSYYGDPQYGDFPVVYVSWDAAKTFCEWAGKRLPTEAEWEKAARGTDGRIYPWGNAFDKDLLNSFEGGRGDTTAIGSFPGGASPYGVMDMAGNVWEWTADWYSGNYYGTWPARNPTGPSAGQLRAVRGGSWNYLAGVMRVAYRYINYPIYRYHIGFRCVK